MTDEETATLTVASPPGQQFGNTDFKAYNIDFENRAVSFNVIFFYAHLCIDLGDSGQLLYFSSSCCLIHLCKCFLLWLYLC
jgi:hypothetical protein